MTNERDESDEHNESDERADRSGGIGGVVGAAPGPFAATVGGGRVGPKATVGDRRGDGEAVPVEIEGVGSGDSGGLETVRGPTRPSTGPETDGRKGKRVPVAEPIGPCGWSYQP